MNHTHTTATQLLCDFVVGDGLADHGLVGRHQPFEFFKPVEDDVDFGLSGFLLTSFGHKEPPIRPDIVGRSKIVVIVFFKQTLRTLEAELRVGINGCWSELLRSFSESYPSLLSLSCGRPCLVESKCPQRT